MDLYILWCAAPDEFFELDPARVNNEILHQLVGKGAPCNGGGVPGMYCLGCPFVEGESKTDVSSPEDF